ncbi:MAG: 4-hydroxy-3-methylbut-2-en-1-yl diphosphate synthase (ferredoxin) [Elusimicrobia bacterium]|nr:4-hydroxy-3-methylbut-2-en-1-yl diphosphate synthase (ferredoxin) [Elusimicrobiota bacterium]
MKPLRRPTREVKVGTVGVGGTNPIRLQSMTTTDTMNTEATVAQVLRLAEVGCEIARITAPTALDARNLEAIKSSLIKKKCRIPLVADIHFRPDAAMVAADFVEKVRINPGNFVDGKAFKVREYTDEEYRDEIKRIEGKFTPLVLKLKKLKRALRIGTNHGSLSDRIMNRYGDTPEGMVESALEYARICEQNQFFDIIFSMKASNPKIMIAAYRLLVKRMTEENMNYPLHLGVTEAGDGPDGRIKSAVGIGSLLEDGIGDTIRVSLTEDPEFEIPVAKELARHYETLWKTHVDRTMDGQASFNTRRETEPVMSGPISIGGAAPIRIVSSLMLQENSADSLMALMENRFKKEVPPEIIVLPFRGPSFATLYSSFRSQMESQTHRLSYWISCSAENIDATLPPADAYVVHFQNHLTEGQLAAAVQLCRQNSAGLVLASAKTEPLIQAIERLKNGRMTLLAWLDFPQETLSVHEARRFMLALKSFDEKIPLVLSVQTTTPSLPVASVLGSLICDGLGDAIQVASSGPSEENLDFAYNLLQACGSRITKTEFVSCPSCGRTLFDLQSTTERIKAKTGHLKGVKIAIMGCIVNGPGEMADADFGYVGGGPGKINLYVGKTCVEKSIPSEIADEKLIELIKSHGKWADPLVHQTVGRHSEGEVCI